MTAQVDRIYQWYCADCSAGEGPFDFQDEAAAAAAEHDKSNHYRDYRSSGRI